ncbi:response regulator transcription factor [Pseudohalioglobus sediminis]|uniref:Response regulator transcription factor n=1 Tax=Pseudohalioglobus sediminis TaxID=2606449 RepID=A0A5B0WSP6_9GAMM|nr:winged helix-turn-helix domain-containing protein [Pseudohalioglobus sediminis]KAA1190090.1 response regulator transcription factor [Pseudohalioglobus sediminis]
MIEDNIAFVRSFRKILEAEGNFVLQDFQSADRAMKHYWEGDFDVVIVDLQLDGSRNQGFDFMQWLRREEKKRMHLPVPILVLTSDTSAGSIAKCFGLDGAYVPKGHNDAENLVGEYSKSERPEPAVEAIKSLIRRKKSYESKFSHRGLELTPKGEFKYNSSPFLKDKEKMRRILHCLMENAPEVVSRRKLEQVAWDAAIGEGNNLNTEINKLRDAIAELNPAPPVAIETHRGTGYQLILL